MAMQKRSEIIKAIEECTDKLTNALSEYLMLDDSNLEAKNALFGFLCWKLRPIFPLDMPSPHDKHKRYLADINTNVQWQSRTGQTMLRVKKERISRKWSVREVGRLTGIGYSFVSKIERGTYKVHPAWRERLSKLYGVPEDELFQEAEK